MLKILIAKFVTLVDKNVIMLCILWNQTAKMLNMCIHVGCSVCKIWL